MHKSCLLLLPALLVLALPNLHAQTDADWAHVLRVETGRRVELRLAETPSQKLRGWMRSADRDRVIMVDESGTERAYPREQITLVRLRRSDTAPITGLVVGGVWSAAVAGISDGSNSQRVSAVAILTGGGWLIGKGIQRGNWKTVYKAR